MGQGPYGTSGVCAHTESAAIEGAYAATAVANTPGYGNDPTRVPAMIGLACLLSGCLEAIPYAISAAAPYFYLYADKLYWFGQTPAGHAVEGAVEGCLDNCTPENVINNAVFEVVFPTSQILHESELGSLPKAAPGTDTIVLGHYFLPGEVYDLPGLGPRDLSIQPYFLETELLPAAGQLGGRTLVSFPGDIEVMQREIRKADRIIFFTRPDMRGLTMQEMEFIQSHSELRDKTIFIYGGLREPFPRIK